ncbi:MAG: CcmD family protein [Rufibacter sp.]
MKMHKWILMLLLTWAAAFAAPASAQPQEMNTVEFSAEKTQDAGPEMADVMRRDGKIYIVVAVLVTVLLGVLFYLISLDKKIGKLERELRQ